MADWTQVKERARKRLIKMIEKHEAEYITVDEKLKVGGYAIADGQTDAPVRVVWLGKIFASVEDVKTNHQWDIMANRLTAISNPDANS